MSFAHPRLQFRDIVVASASVLVTAAVLAQSLGGQALEARDFLQLKLLNHAFKAYLEDNSGLYPMAFGKDSAGAYMWSSYHYVPDDWPDGPGSDGSYARRIVASPSFWANGLRPYTAGPIAFEAPGMNQVVVGASGAHLGAGKRKTQLSYAYNGLLMSYSAGAVASPATLPTVWHGLGKSRIDGAGLSTPALNCPTAGQPCTYLPWQSGCGSWQNGRTSVLFTSPNTIWVYQKRAAWLAVDGHAEHRALGAVIAPDDTDYNVDPFNQYDPNGFGTLYWWDGCHPWLFRPDH
ncbi:MAG: hypothetical protein JST30_11795 [Armatimonadetes bacterium]|nr:hypothetical protein [Armatimonadota bacterium]